MIKEFFIFLKYLIIPPLFLILLSSLFIGCIYFYNFDTKEHIVAVIDSGVEKTHEKLQGKVLQGYDFVDMDNEATDFNGHGTNVAGIITSVSPKSYILPVRIINQNGHGSLSTALPIVYAIIKGADVINMSYVEDRHNILTQLVINMASKKGILMIAATGNEGKNEIGYPAKYNNVISIAAVDEHNNPFKGNNIDYDLDFLALGVEVNSPDLHNSYNYSTGTSISAATATGIISYLQTTYPELSDNEILFKLKELSEPLYANNQFKVIDVGIVKQKTKNTFETKSHNEFTIQPMGEMNGQEYIKVSWKNFNNVIIKDANELLITKSTLKENNNETDKQYFISLENYVFPLSINTISLDGNISDYIYEKDGTLSKMSRNTTVTYNNKT